MKNWKEILIAGAVIYLLVEMSKKSTTATTPSIDQPQDQPFVHTAVKYPESKINLSPIHKHRVA